MSRLGSKGGKKRAAIYDKETLSKWAKKGGRPQRKAKAMKSKIRRSWFTRRFRVQGSGGFAMRMRTGRSGGKVGNKGAAIKLYQKRKTEVLQGKKLPEQLRAKPVTFTELADDAIEWAKAHKLTWRMMRSAEANA